MTWKILEKKIFQQLNPKKKSKLMKSKKSTNRSTSTSKTTTKTSQPTISTL